MVVVEGFIEFIISARLVFASPVTSVDHTTFSFTIAWIIMIGGVVILPYLYFKIIM